MALAHKQAHSLAYFIYVLLFDLINLLSIFIPAAICRRNGRSSVRFFRTALQPLRCRSVAHTSTLKFERTRQRSLAHSSTRRREQKVNGSDGDRGRTARGATASAQTSSAHSATTLSHETAKPLLAMEQRERRREEGEERAAVERDDHEGDRR